MSRTGQTVRQDRLRSDSIWWTTLQTVTQKPKRTDSAVFGEPKRKSKINSADPYHPLHLFRWWSPTDSEGRDIIHLHQQHPGLQGVDRQTDKSAANGTKTAVSTHKYTQSHIHANQVIIKDEFVSTMCMLSCTDRQTHACTCKYHHHTTIVLWFFSGPSGCAGARRELLDFMVHGKINRGRHTDHLTGRHSIRTNQLVSWSLTSLFGTNLAISETKGQGWKVIRTQWRKASDILTSTLAAFLFSSHPKKGKGSRGSFKLLR